MVEKYTADWSGLMVSQFCCSPEITLNNNKNNDITKHDWAHVGYYTL